MELGMVGLGRMGANLVRRLHAAGHTCVVHDLDARAVARLASDGATAADSLEDLVARLSPPRAVWLMLPAAVTGLTVDRLAAVLEPADVVVDGGNSFYRDDVARAAALEPLGIHYVDVGTSGGVFGRDRGFCLMIGGEDDTVTRLAPIFDALAPGVDAAPRTPTRAGTAHPAEDGWLHCGPVGAGHFVKMVHNGIEYALMAAYAEGFNILRNASVGLQDRRADAETSPLPDAHYYAYDLDLAAIAELWRRGSVISSWLLDLTASALHAAPDLAGFEGNVSDSGEGRWTVQAAVDEGVPAPVISAALFDRFASRGNADFAHRLLSALRREFGGHEERAPGS